jgi:hypothetical protein
MGKCGSRHEILSVKKAFELERPKKSLLTRIGTLYNENNLFKATSGSGWVGGWGEHGTDYRG